jgi:hypothetical protein
MTYFYYAIVTLQVIFALIFIVGVLIPTIMNYKEAKRGSTQRDEEIYK